MSSLISAVTLCDPKLFTALSCGNRTTLANIMEVINKTPYIFASPQLKKNLKNHLSITKIHKVLSEIDRINNVKLRRQLDSILTDIEIEKCCENIIRNHSAVDLDDFITANMDLVIRDSSGQLSTEKLENSRLFTQKLINEYVDFDLQKLCSELSQKKAAAGKAPFEKLKN